MDIIPDSATEEMPEPEAGQETTEVVYEPVHLDEDGRVDGIFARISSALSFTALDSDSDLGLDTARIDFNGDGEPDVLITESEGGYLVADASGESEGTWISREELVNNFPELVGVLDAQLPAPTDVEEGTDQPVEPDLDSTEWSVEEGTLIGDPTGDAQFWFQQAQNGFCLPASIAQIVSEYTGVIYENEMPFVNIANELGAFVVGPDGIPGIPMEKGVEILNEAGVPAEYGFGDIDTLAADLEAGRSIILFVDSGELWTGEASEDNAADHAVVVTGIDTERGTVLLSDPGTPGGNLAEVPIGLFLNSWADSQNAMIVCDEPPTESGDAVDTTAVDGQPTTPDGTSPTPEPTEETGAEPLEATTSWAIQSPWVLLPITLLSTSLSAL